MQLKKKDRFSWIVLKKKGERRNSGLFDSCERKRGGAVDLLRGTVFRIVSTSTHQQDARVVEVLLRGVFGGKFMKNRLSLPGHEKINPRLYNPNRKFFSHGFLCSLPVWRHAWG